MRDLDGCAAQRTQDTGRQDQSNVYAWESYVVDQGREHGPIQFYSTRKSNIPGHKTFAAVTLMVLLVLGCITTQIRDGYAQSPPAPINPIDQFDVMGIKIGMPISQAQKILSSNYKGRINETFDIIYSDQPSFNDAPPYPNAPSLRIRYRANNGTLVVTPAPQTTDEMMQRQQEFEDGEISRDEVTGEIKRFQGLTDKFVLELQGTPNNETIAAISRGTMFPSGAQPTVDATILALKAKYGNYVSLDDSRSSLMRSLLWYYDPRNRLIKSDSPEWNSQSQCIQESDGSHDLEREDPAVPSGATSGCGFFVSVSVVFNQANPSLVAYLGIIVEDNNTLYKTLVWRQTYFQNLKAQQQQNQVNSAAGIKPSL